MKQEGVAFLATFPTTPVIESAAGVGIRPVVCRQERVGVGMADGYARMTNGNPVGAFAMQFGPGAENAFAGVATAFSDSVPLLVLPLGHRRDRAQVYPHFSSARAFESVLKSVETINVAQDVGSVMRRAFNAMKQGRAGPAMVEIPEDVALEEVDEAALDYRPVKATRTAGDPQDIVKAARALVEAQCPVILAGQGVLYAEASDDLVELAESLQLPVMTTMEGKSGFPEDHPLSLGAAGGGVMTGPAHHFLHAADLVLAIGCSLTAHFMHVTLPPGTWSSQRHWHSGEDEFVYILEGRPTLVTDDGRTPLAPGMCAGFPAGEANGHHLVNDTDVTATYLEVGTRRKGDNVDYPDIDMQIRGRGTGGTYAHKDGTPYA